jgi:hypothetical protein
MKGTKASPLLCTDLPKLQFSYYDSKKHQWKPDVGWSHIKKYIFEPLVPQFEKAIIPMKGKGVVSYLTLFLHEIKGGTWSGVVKAVLCALAPLIIEASLHVATML